MIMFFLLSFLVATLLLSLQNYAFLGIFPTNDRKFPYGGRFLSVIFAS